MVNFNPFSTHPVVHQKQRFSRSSHKSTIIREKAQLARAETYVVEKKENEGQLSGREEPQSDDLIGPDGQMRSCDSSVNSSTGLTDQSTADTYQLVSTREGGKDGGEREGGREVEREEGREGGREKGREGRKKDVVECFQVSVHDC